MVKAAIALFFKAHIKGYKRKSGVAVRAHERPARPALSPVVSVKPIKRRGKNTLHPRAVDHPQEGLHGKSVRIHEPSIPSMARTWMDPMATAVFVPAGETPGELNGIAFAPWAAAPETLDEWQDVDGQLPSLDEPDLITNSKEAAAGVIIEEADGRIWLVNPTNGFSGYTTTFPKGRSDDGLSLQATAIKEAFEESGLQVEITGLIGDVERSQTVTRYYRARRVGGTPAAMGWETQAVQLVPKKDVFAALNQVVDHVVAKLAGIDNSDSAA
jgi:ADP-ribose pyrophosphatase YjhB (NUDIX family)